MRSLDQALDTTAPACTSSPPPSGVKLGFGAAGHGGSSAKAQLEAETRLGRSVRAVTKGHRGLWCSVRGHLGGAGWGGKGLRMGSGVGSGVHNGRGDGARRRN